MRKKISNPHDSLFKAMMSREEIAKDFFHNHLPEGLAKLIDVDSLEIRKDSFVEKELKQFYSDILYQVSFKGGKGYIYLLFEHQSKPYRLIAFRLLRYMVKIWEQELKAEPELVLLPPIIPLVLYHGRAGWDISESFMDLIREEGVKGYVPDFSYILYDLSRYSDEEIRGAVIVKVFLMLFKHIFDEEFSGRLRGLFGLLKELSSGDKSSLEYIEMFLRYIMSTREDTTPEILKEIIEDAISEETGGVVMTVAEQLIKKGISEGRAEGLIKGELIGDIRIAQLKKGMPVSDKEDLEKLSTEELQIRLKALS